VEYTRLPKVDEYNTSCKCCDCLSEAKQVNPTVPEYQKTKWTKDPLTGKRKKMKVVLNNHEVYKLLQCQTKGCCSTHQRDLCGGGNIWRVAYEESHGGVRPKTLCRPDKPAAPTPQAPEGEKTPPKRRQRSKARRAKKLCDEDAGPSVSPRVLEAKRPHRKRTASAADEKQHDESMSISRTTATKSKRRKANGWTRLSMLSSDGADSGAEDFESIEDAEWMPKSKQRKTEFAPPAPPSRRSERLSRQNNNNQRDASAAGTTSEQLMTDLQDVGTFVPPRQDVPTSGDTGARETTRTAPRPG
jgi:hypothetical protein